MTDFLFDIGYVTNLALIIVVLGYTFVGLVFGYVWGHERALRRASELRRSLRAHPSNQR